MPGEITLDMGLAASPEAPEQPQRAHRLRLVIGADPLGSFTNISHVAYELRSYDLLGEPWPHSPHLRSYSGPGTHGEINLGKGLVHRGRLMSWFASTALGPGFRQTVFLFHLNPEGFPHQLYTFTDCWPKQWTVADQNPLADEVATQVLTIGYSNLHMVSSPFG